MFHASLSDYCLFWSVDALYKLCAVFIQTIFLEINTTNVNTLLEMFQQITHMIINNDIITNFVNFVRYQFTPLYLFRTVLYLLLNKTYIYDTPVILIVFKNICFNENMLKISKRVVKRTSYKKIIHKYGTPLISSSSILYNSPSH